MAAVASVSEGAPSCGAFPFSSVSRPASPWKSGAWNFHEVVELGPRIFMRLFNWALLLFLRIFQFGKSLSLLFSWVKMLRRMKNTTNV
jgi:hypothetical protein